ncbi:hypothetical protein BDW42DRAFT_190013 [Aspergillus taichungensis]|uniref:HTH APSES-type domain-containing protein n=1 Tax=Aspergillus taichungensis TaxID=482145 RepID=A0A2J5I8S0_9EURO|nr:hypothetical protein BDW42DRAFT_190013 [Aspergillus taichungensis]
MAKDAPIFNRGRVRGECRFAPCEHRDAELLRLHREFQIHPMADIAEFPRHIPYNSDKKSFQEKTGRGGFEVFQYTFKIPGQDKLWTVMWDYNIGLVRTTHLFKCLDYSKTTPAKVLNANPGLREICHSITGGALAAQGYWMPYTAARAIAATFCWKIRFALTPLFGVDFPNDCIHPGDRNLFGRMIISPQVIQMATSETSVYRRMERGGEFASLVETGGYVSSRELGDARLYRPLSSDGTIANVNANIQSGRTPFHHHHGYNRVYGREGGRGGGGYRSSPDYSTDISTTSTTAASTASRGLSAASPRNTFTPVNTPRYLDGLQREFPSPETLSSSMRRMSVQQRTIPVTTAATAAKTAAASSGSDGENHNNTHLPIELPRKRKPSAALFAREVKAAHALLDLHTTATASDDEFVGSLACRVGAGVGTGAGCGSGSAGSGNGGGGEGARKRRRASA